MAAMIVLILAFFNILLVMNFVTYVWQTARYEHDVTFWGVTWRTLLVFFFGVFVAWGIMFLDWKDAYEWRKRRW